MKKHTNFILVVCFLLGLGILAYPFVSNYWNSFHQSSAIAGYSNTVSSMKQEEFDAIWAQADLYNEEIQSRYHRFIPTEEEHEQYIDTLNVNGDGVLGYLEIPNIRVSLPMYHTVKDSVLQIATGHIEGSSLPVGGPSTHCILSGHRGLPSAKLLTDLDQVLEGDLFMLHVLNETLTYQVDQIRIVEPEDISNLNIDPEKDYCTLVTCTPYGINSHRLLVRGKRVENLEEATKKIIPADAVQIDPVQVLPFVAAPLAILAVFWLLYGNRYHRR